MTFIGVKYVPGSLNVAKKHVSNTYTLYILYLYLRLQVDGSQSAMSWVNNNLSISQYVIFPIMAFLLNARHLGYLRAQLYHFMPIMQHSIIFTSCRPAFPPSF